MSALQCLSCEHANPPDAKFCQECGSALNVKLCQQCEAINGAKAERCYKCDSPFVARDTKPSIAPSIAPRRRRVIAIAAAAGFLVLAGALVVAFVASRPRAPASAAVKQAPVPVVAAPVKAQAEPAPVPVVEKTTRPVVEKSRAVVERPGAPRPVAVTHTRAAAPVSRPAPAAPSPAAPSPQRNVVAEQPMAEPPASPPSHSLVTHTKRVADVTPTKAEGNQ